MSGRPSSSRTSSRRGPDEETGTDGGAGSGGDGAAVGSGGGTGSGADGTASSSTRRGGSATGGSSDSSGSGAPTGRAIAAVVAVAGRGRWSVRRVPRRAT